MSNNEIINGISAIANLCSAYQSLKNDVLDRECFEKKACDFLEHICYENNKLIQAKSIDNSSDGAGCSIGSINLPLGITGAMQITLQKLLPNLFSGHEINVNAKIDFSKTFSISFTSNGVSEIAKEFVQNLITTALSNNQALNLRCADLMSGGNFFASLHELISAIPTRTAGKVYTKHEELSDLVKELEKFASTAMTKLSCNYKTVEEYNKVNDVRINEYLTVVYLTTNSYHNSDINRLKILVENGRRNGMSFIIVGSAEATEQISDCMDFQFYCADSCVYVDSCNKVSFTIDHCSTEVSADIKTLISAMKNSEQIDTRYENHPSLHTEYFTMDSADALRVPFALDKNNKPLYFEIGGNAPSHALIAGSTGSGKSVALHSIIMQIIHNYHPDDVEIWAIDYKAVEFASYFDNRTPHFRVVAHDKSSEFSLSLIDLLWEEYEKREKAFLEAKVKNINQYRRLYGKYSMSRILVIIDEFQLMTQAVQEYTGSVNYRTRLENLFRLTRAMGISFILCSQTIATGLSGLSEASRDQIGCRICLKHDDDNEIRETLMISGTDVSEIVEKAKNLRAGQCIYKRARWKNEYSPDGKSYEFIESNVLFFNDEIKTEIINTANNIIKGNYNHKEEILVRGGDRIAISEKQRHPISRFIQDTYVPSDECVEWYPAAPSTLADYFCVEMDNTAAMNILFVGEDDELRESTVIHSVCGFLMNSDNNVIVSVVDEDYPDRARMISHLSNIKSKRLTINVGLAECLNTIVGLKRIRPTRGQNNIYIWYGLDKLKNELFLMKQDEEDIDADVPVEALSREDLVKDLTNFLSDITNNSSSNTNVDNVLADDLTFDDCKTILRQAFDVGPENNKFHFVIFNNKKSMSKSDLIDLSCFENRVGTRMSTDDSYDLFGSSLATSSANENTVVYYTGSGQVTPLRPYLIPSDDWYDTFNNALEELL